MQPRSCARFFPRGDLLQVLDDEIMREFHAIIATYAPATEGMTMTYAEKLISEGLERGRAEGARERACAAVLEVLMARGLPISATQQARVEACTDLDTLSRWLRAAATAEVADAIFEA